MLRINLEGAGCAVDEAATEDLLALPRHGPYHALVLNLNGRDRRLCEAVNAMRRRNEGLVVAAYSVWPLDEMIRRLCIDMYVETPFDVSRFAEAVRRACERGAVPAGMAEVERAL